MGQSCQQHSDCPSGFVCLKKTALCADAVRRWDRALLFVFCICIYTATIIISPESFRKLHYLVFYLIRMKCASINSMLNSIFYCLEADRINDWIVPSNAQIRHMEEGRHKRHGLRNGARGCDACCETRRVSIRRNSETMEEIWEIRTEAWLKGGTREERKKLHYCRGQSRFPIVVLAALFSLLFSSKQI